MRLGADGRPVCHQVARVTRRKGKEGRVSESKIARMHHSSGFRVQTIQGEVANPSHRPPPRRGQDQAGLTTFDAHDSCLGPHPGDSS